MMRTIIRFSIVLLCMWCRISHAQIIGVRIPDTTAINGAIIDLPVYVDSSTTGKGIISYQFKIAYNNTPLSLLGIITSGTLSAGYGTPVSNVNTATNTLTVSGAGTTPLSGSGVLFYLRFQLNQPTYVSFTFQGVANCFFNQGTPAMALRNGSINILATPTIIASYASAGPITVGDSVQVNVSGGTSPYSYSVTNAAVATISSTGMLKAIGAGLTKVRVQSANSIVDTTDNFMEIRAIKISLPDTTVLPLANFVYPIRINSTSGLGIVSGSFRINYSQSSILPDSVVLAGTLLAGASVTYQYFLNYMLVSFASTVPLSGAGDLLKLRFRVINPSASNITIQDVLFNQNILANSRNSYVNFTSVAALGINPSYGEFLIGQTQQYTATGGRPPYTFSVTDTTKASITTSGFCTAKKGGLVKVRVTDSLNTQVETSFLQVYDGVLSLPTFSVLSGSTLTYPVFLSNLSGSTPLYSLQFTLSFPVNTLDSIEVVNINSLSSTWTLTQNVQSDKVIIALAGTTPITTNGIVLRFKAKLKPSVTVGNTLNFGATNVLFNEGNFFGKVTNGYVTVVSSLQKDIGVNTLQAPVSSCTKTTQEVISASIYNYNNTTYFMGDTIIVGFRVNNGAVTRDTVVLSSNLSMNTAFVYTFRTRVNMQTTGAYALKVFTQLPGDINVVNDTFSTVIQVYGNPTVNLGNDTGICSGNTLILNATTPGASYQWSNASTGSTLTVSVGGTYWVRVTTAANCSAVDTVMVSVNPTPVVAKLTGTAYSGFCGIDSVTLSTTPITGGKYRWRLNGANTINTADTLTQLQVKVSGTYSVRVTNTFGCSALSPDSVITISSSRQTPPTLSGISTICSGDSINLTASTLPNVTYKWSGPSGFISSNPSITILNASAVNAGIYSVYVVKIGATTKCDTSLTIVASVVVNPKPIAKSMQVGGSVSLCTGDSVVLSTDFVSSNKYRWFANGLITSNPADTTSALLVKNGGTYTVKVTDNNNCFSFMRDTTVMVNVKQNSPVVSGSNQLCEGDTLRLTASLLSGVSYRWMGPSGYVATTRSIDIPDVSLTQGGAYNVYAIKNGATNRCDTSAPATRSVTINPRPVRSSLIINGNTEFCQGDSVVLTTNQNATYSYRWQRNGINIPDTSYVSVAKISGSYTVKVTGSNGCSSLMLPVQIIVNPKPVITSVTGNIVVAKGSTQPYSTTNNTGSSYQWTVSNGVQISGGATNSIQVKWDTTGSTGSVKVFETSSKGCKGDTFTKVVSILSVVPDTLLLSSDTLFISNSASTRKVKVTSNIAWALSNPNSWITATPVNGFGSDSLSLSFLSNTDSLSRTGLITLTGGSITRTLVVKQSGTVGIEEKEFGGIKKYPIPVHDILYLSFMNGDEGVGALLDMKGTICSEFSMSSLAETAIDCSLLDAGLYVLLVKTDSKIYTSKIFVRH